MSRLIVKSLPNNLPESKLRELFQKFGEVTDCRIIFKDEKNRRFAFIGFKNEESGRKARDYFNNTYINMSKVSVEFAKTLDDDDLPRAWSKITKQQRGDSKQLNKKEKTKEKTEIKLTKLEEKSEKFKEYLELMKKGGAAKNSWSDNLDLYDSKEKKKTKGTKAGEGSDDNEQNEDSNGKIIKKLGNKVAIIQNEKADKKKKNSSDLKEREMENLNSILKKGDNSKLNNSKEEDDAQSSEIDLTRLFVLNLPFQTNDDEVRSLFEKFGKVTSLKLPKGKGGKFTGYAYVNYETQEEAIRAFAEVDNKIHMGRILHVKPAFREKIKEKDPQAIIIESEAKENSSFKREKKMQMLKKLDDQTNWNTLFLNPNSVVGAIADKFNLKKVGEYDEFSYRGFARVEIENYLENLKNFTAFYLEKSCLNK